MLKFFFKAVINFFGFAAFAGKKDRDVISSAENLASEGCIYNSFIIKFAVNLGEIVTKSTDEDFVKNAAFKVFRSGSCFAFKPMLNIGTATGRCCST